MDLAAVDALYFLRLYLKWSLGKNSSVTLECLRNSFDAQSIATCEGNLCVDISSLVASDPGVVRFVI